MKRYTGQPTTCPHCEATNVNDDNNAQGDSLTFLCANCGELFDGFEAPELREVDDEEDDED